MSNATLTAKDYKGEVAPDWCPGCGDFGLLNGMQQALAQLGLEPHRVMIVSGIGCSSNFPGFINTYGMHTLHGRSLPIAQGYKLSNHEMNVIAVGGDGDGYGIGAGHLIHAMRRNVDMTYVVMNNSIYGLTTGQTSPTSGLGMKTKSTPFGNPEFPLNPMTLALGAGCSFVGRAFTGNIKHMVEVIKKAIEHKGFSLVDTFSPCVTFNKVNTLQYYKDNVKDINEMGHDPSNLAAAFEQVTREDYIATGVIYQKPRSYYEESEKDTYALGALVDHDLGIKPERRKELLAQFI